MDNYIRGVDSLELEFTLLNEDGDAIDVSLLDEVTVELITSKKSIPENTVYWTGTITDGKVIAGTGLVTCYIEPSETELWPLKIYYARLTLKETDADFTSGYKYSASVESAFRLIVE